VTNKEKAEIILEKLDEVMQVDWNSKDIYINAIEKALKTINDA